MDLFKRKLFRRELRKDFKLLVIFTIGFTIAFSWRQTIFDASLSIVDSILHFNSTLASSIAASILITLISILILISLSRYLPDNPHDLT